jgi:hypothetical protein
MKCRYGPKRTQIWPKYFNSIFGLIIIVGFRCYAQNFLIIFGSSQKSWLKKLLSHFVTLCSDNIVIHQDTYEIQRCAWTSSE